MSDRAGASRFGSNTRIVAVLAAMAPVVAGIYQQSQQERQRDEQRHAEQQALKESRAARDKEASERQRALSVQADESTAAALQKALVVAQPQERWVGSQRVVTEHEFCTRLMFAASQLVNQSVTDRTRAILYAAMRLRRSDDEQLRVCQCSSPARIDDWFGELEQMMPSQQEPAPKRLSAAVRYARDECKTAAATPGAGASPTDLAHLRAQLAKAQTDLDALRRRVSAELPEVSAAAPRGPSAAPKPRDGVPASGSAPVAAVPAAPTAPPLAMPASAPAAAPPACTIGRPAQGTPRIRVFIQVPQADDIADAEVLRAALNAQPPFKSPGIETVGASRSPRRLEIRYTYPADLPAAELVQQALASGRCGGGSAAADVRLAYQPRFQGRVDTGVIEVWWPAPTPAARSPR